MNNENFLIEKNKNYKYSLVNKEDLQDLFYYYLLNSKAISIFPNVGYVFCKNCNTIIYTTNKKENKFGINIQEYLNQNFTLLNTEQHKILQNTIFEIKLLKEFLFISQDEIYFSNNNVDSNSYFDENSKTIENINILQNVKNLNESLLINNKNKGLKI